MISEYTKWDNLRRFSITLWTLQVKAKGWQVKNKELRKDKQDGRKKFLRKIGDTKKCP